MKKILLVAVLVIFNTFCSQTEKLSESSSTNNSTKSISTSLEEYKIGITTLKEFSDTYQETIESLGDFVPDYPFLISKNVKDSKYEVVALASGDYYICLVYSVRNLQLLGFISRQNNTFYFFSDTPASIIGILPDITSYTSLRYDGTYKSLGAPRIFTLNNMVEHIEILSTYTGYDSKFLKPILADVRYLVIDSLRFKSIALDIEEKLFSKKAVDPSLYQDDYLNWEKWSKLAFDFDLEAIKKIGIANIH